VHQIYYRIHRIPVLGGVAYEAARAYKTYRAVQRAFLDQALPDHLFAVHDHVSHVRNLAEKQARADARMRYEVRLEQQQRGREIQELASAPQLNEEIAGLHKRLEFVRNELMFELREATGSSPGGAHEVQPQLKDESIRDRAEKRLNVGCGHIPLEGYINVDRRDLPGVDIVAEASGIPLEDGTVDEIFSSHLLEHFPVETLRRRVLPHWHALLRPGGVIGAIVPDAEAMFEGYQNETVSFDDLRTVTYGLQEYEGDFHFNMFSRGSLTQAFEEAGFEKPQFVFTARRNGMCFDMHIRATKCMSERAQPAEKLDAAQ
jgi:predicted SAM-dependent methyltransferase